jgi:hypothetical protein
MSPYVIGSLTARVTTICLLGFALAGCQKGAIPVAGQSDDFTWARKALERNPQLEVLASDAQSGVYTVRNKTTGEVLALKLDDIAAAPVAQLKSPPPALPAAPAAPAVPAEPVASAPPAPNAPAASTPPTTPSVPAPERSPASRSVPATAQNASATTPGYTVEREAGRVRVSGPGVSIVSSGQANTVSAKSESGGRWAEPIICEGRRMIHLDDRDIYVDGDAITARNGCEMYITNSRIVASGTGIVVRGATVHVSNSHIEGANGSFDADDRAKVFVRSSEFHGIPRRTELASVQDQGGNQWR